MPRKTLRGAVLGFFPFLTKLMKLISDLLGLYMIQENALMLLLIHKRLYHA